jgi:dTDP-4-amino-4,6-dideoxygalactose transaminase
VTRVPIVRPDLGELEIEQVARVIRSGWVTQGPEVGRFEAAFAAAVGAPHAVAVSNCTVALELSLRVLGVGRGDEVATVSHSFVATANAVLAVGATPVFVDVEEDTLGMSPAGLARAITPRTRAVLCVHQLGIPCDIEALLAVCGQRGLPLVEDAACALGSEALRAGAWQAIGRPAGRLACFSFHPRKIVTTGDGGMLTTADAELDGRLRRLRQHGMSVSDAERHAARRVVVEQYVEPGFNARLTDLQAAVGLPQLARLPAILAERRALAARLSAALEHHPVLAPPRPRPEARWNWQSYPARLRPGHEPRQLKVLERLHERGIAAKPGVTNAHEEPAYRGRGHWRAAPGGLAVSERLRRTTVLLPLFHGMTGAEQEQLLSALEALDRDLGGR